MIQLVISLFLMTCPSIEDLSQNEIELVYLSVEREGTVTDTIQVNFEEYLDKSGFEIICMNRAISFAQLDNCFQLPLLDALHNHTRLVGTKTIVNKVSATDTIRKYRYDDINTEDEETYIFSSKRYGIVSVKSATWGGYIILTKKSDVPDSDIEWITKSLISDTIFFEVN